VKIEICINKNNKKKGNAREGLRRD